MDRRPRSAAVRGATLLLVLGVAATGCAINPAPRKWLSSAYEAESTAAYGGWLQLELRSLTGRMRPAEVEGEFLAVGPDSFVRVLTEVGVREIPLLRIEKARLTGYDVDQNVGLWTFPGVVMTASNGWILVITAPLWLITGTISTLGVWKKAQASVPRRSWNDLRIYARFPQGWPGDLDPASIRPDARWPEVARRLHRERELIEKESGSPGE